MGRGAGREQRAEMAFDSGPFQWQGSRPIRPAPARGLQNSKVFTVANPELGAKQVCPNCQAKFYDLTRRPAHCPKCDTEFEPEELLKVRKGRGRAGVPDYEDQAEDADDQVKAKTADDEDEEEEEVKTPEIDEAANEIPPEEDEDDDGSDPTKAPGMGDADDEVLEDEEEDDSVPFLEDDEDEDFDEEIDGLGDAGEEET